MGHTNTNTLNWLVLLLIFFLIDELAFILYNISFFQFMCANTINLFFTDEIPSYVTEHIYSSTNIPLFVVQLINSSFYLYSNLDCLDMYNLQAPFLDFSVYTTETGSSSITSQIEQFDLQTTYYKVKLEATNVKKNICSFYPLQHHIYTIPGESSLIFYRLENKTMDSIQTLSVYVTTPSEAVAYIKKLQCFCYEELMIAPNSVIDLPILFSIDEEILTEEFKEITINYILLLK